MRALAGGVEHQVSYAGTDTHVGKEDVRLPALPPRATPQQTVQPCGWRIMTRQHIAACARHWMVRGRFSNLPSGRVSRPSVQMT
jgi:hypothetical protein